MSALTPHIRVLRAEAWALELELAKVDAQNWVLIDSIARAKRNAADLLEAEEAALKPPREGLDEEITYDPKGKPKS